MPAKPVKVGALDVGGRIARVLVLDTQTDAALGSLLYDLPNLLEVCRRATGSSLPQNQIDDLMQLGREAYGHG